MSALLCITLIHSAAAGIYAENFPTVLEWQEESAILELEKDFSPYIIQKDFVVDKQKVLIVKPGVKVILNQGASLIVKGRLVAEGGKRERIEFTCENKRYPWGVLFFDNAEKISTLAFCDIKYGGGHKYDSSSAGGSVAVSSSNVVIEYCNISENSADKGGAIYAENSELYLRGNFITRNEACEGGAFYFVLSKARFIGNTIAKNHAANIAGAVMSFNSRLDFARNRIIGNKSEVEGCLYQEDSEVRLKYNNISRNKGKKAKPALISEIITELPRVIDNERKAIADDIKEYEKTALAGSDLKKAEIKSVKKQLIEALSGVKNQLVLASKYSPYIIKDDIVVEKSGVLIIQAGTVLEMARNVSIVVRGRLLVKGASSRMVYLNAANEKKPWRGITFVDTDQENVIEWAVVNGASGMPVRIDNAQKVKVGGAVSAVDSTVSILNSNFEMNYSDYGGAVFAEGSNIIVLKNSFQRNNARNEGGALYIRSSTAEITDNDFFENSSEYSGGAIYLFGSDPEIKKNNIYENKSKNGSAVIYCCGSRPKIRDNQYLKNSGKNLAVEPIAQEEKKRRSIKICLQ